MAKKQSRAAEQWRYVLTADRALPLEEQSVFVLRPLTQIERLDVRDNLTRFVVSTNGTRTSIARSHRLSLDLCVQNIVRVENFPAGASEPWPEALEARLAYLEALDDEAVQELGNEIYLRSTLGDDAKNA